MISPTWAKSILAGVAVLVVLEGLCAFNLALGVSAAFAWCGYLVYLSWND